MKYRFAFLSANDIVFVTAMGGAFYIPASENFDLPEVVRIPAGQYPYCPAGDSHVGTLIVDAPLEQRTAHSDFEIMKYYVSQSEYAKCVADGGYYATRQSGV